MEYDELPTPPGEFKNLKKVQKTFCAQIQLDLKSSTIMVGISFTFLYQETEEKKTPPYFIIYIITVYLLTRMLF